MPLASLASDKASGGASGETSGETSVDCARPAMGAVIFYDTKTRERIEPEPLPDDVFGALPEHSSCNSSRSGSQDATQMIMVVAQCLTMRRPADSAGLVYDAKGPVYIAHVRSRRQGVLAVAGGTLALLPPVAKKTVHDSDARSRLR